MLDWLREFAQLKKIDRELASIYAKRMTLTH